MANVRKQNTSFRLSPDARTRLLSLAERRGVSMGFVLEDLINKAWDDPDSYYLRTAAIQSWMAGALSIFIAEKVLGQDVARQVMANVDQSSTGLFGPIPVPPDGLADLRVADPRVHAIFEAYRGQFPTA